MSTSIIAHEDVSASTDSTGEQIKKVLLRSNNAWRTVRGIARESGMSVNDIEVYISAHANEFEKPNDYIGSEPVIRLFQKDEKQPSIPPHMAEKFENDREEMANAVLEDAEINREITTYKIISIVVLVSLYIFVIGLGIFNKNIYVIVGFISGIVTNFMTSRIKRIKALGITMQEVAERRQKVLNKLNG